MIAMFGGWGYVGVIIGLYLLLGGSLRGVFIFPDGVNSWFEPLYLCFFTVLTWALYLALRTWLKKKGSSVFEKL